MHDSFWTLITKSLTTIASDKPDTFDKVKAILDDGADPKECPNSAFFSGSGGDDTLEDSLCCAGWETVWSDASYYYIMRHKATRDTLTYIEGDVYRGHNSELVVN